jgi:hypothetical protein
MIDQCVSANDRQHGKTQDQLEELAISIRKGLKHPILVTYDAQSDWYMVIDGLARIQAASLLGHVTIEALVVTKLEQATKLLTATTKTDGQPAYRRMHEISEALQPLVMARRTEGQRRFRQGLPIRDAGGLSLLATALDMGANNFKGVRGIYKREFTVPGVAEILARLDAGELTLHQARSQVLDLGMVAPVPDTKPNNEQAATLAAVARALGVTVKTGADVAANLTLAAEELNVQIKNLRAARTQLSTLIHTLEKSASHD